MDRRRAALLLLLLAACTQASVRVGHGWGGTSPDHSCSSDLECPAPAICRDRTCQLVVETPQQACATADDCPDHAECEQGICVHAPRRTPPAPEPR